MPDNVPEAGDVVIHSGERAMPSYAIYAVPGPDQFSCATREEAERMARSCAKRSGVNLWFCEVSSSFTLLARFRGAARGQPGKRPQSMARPSPGGGAKPFGRAAT